MSKPRIEEWTELRGLAFLAVVLQHCIGEYIYRTDIQQADSVMLAMVYHLTRFGTPTFVFLSAALLFYNDRKQTGYPHYIFQRFKDIYVPFLCWTLVYCASVQNWATVGRWNDWSFYQGLLREMIIPVSGYHLWFVVMIFQLYIFFPLLNRAARKAGAMLNLYPVMTHKWLVLGGLVVSGAAYALLLHWSYYDMSGWETHVPAFIQSLLHYRTYNFLMYFFYFILGAVCARMTADWRELVQKSFPWNLFVFIGLFMLMGHTMLTMSGDTINLNISTYLKPSTFLLIMSQLLLLYGLLLNLQTGGTPGVFRRMLGWMGRYSFGGYLAHALVLSWIAYFTRTLPLTGYHFAAALISFVVVAAGALGVSWLLAQLPGGHWTVGSKNKRKVPKFTQVTIQGANLQSSSKSTHELG